MEQHFPIINLSNRSGLMANDETFTASGSNVYVGWTVTPENGIGFAASHDYGVTFNKAQILANASGDHGQEITAVGNYVYVVFGPSASLIDQQRCWNNLLEDHRNRACLLFYAGPSRESMILAQPMMSISRGQAIRPGLTRLMSA